MCLYQGPNIWPFHILLGPRFPHFAGFPLMPTASLTEKNRSNYINATYIIPVLIKLSLMPIVQSTSIVITCHIANDTKAEY